jgi:hypothetical protein
VSADSLKALDLDRPIREADMNLRSTHRIEAGGDNEFSIKNNSLPRLVVLSQRLSQSTRGPLWIDMYFFNASSLK